MQKHNSFFLHYIMHDMKFKNKLRLICLLLVLIPTLVIIAFLYGRLSNIITTNTIDSEHALFNQTAVSLESTINRLDQAMESIILNSYLSTASSGSDIYEYLVSNQNTEAARNFYNNINTLLEQDLITSIKIYIPIDDNSSFNADAFNNPAISKIIEPEINITSTYWHGIFSGKPDTVNLLCPEFYLSKKEIEGNGSAAYIHRIKNIFDHNNASCYIAIYFSTDYLENVLFNNMTYADSLYYIINSRNSLVASSNDALSGTYFIRYENIPSVIGNQAQFSEIKILDSNLFIGYQNLNNSDWRLVTVIQAKNLSQKSNSILVNSLIFYLIFAVIAYIIAFALSSSITKRLSQVVDKMNQHRTSMPEKFEETNDHDEIGQLIENYNTMVDRMNLMMLEQTESAEKLKFSEVQALQAQINPHFLYNMLDMINWLAKSNKQKEVSLAVQTLSKFYKLTLSKKEITIPIAKELEHAELYVMLQNMRFEDRIQFIVDVPEEIYEYMIPKLVLQPIVENSILHGIFEKDTKEGSIVIAAWEENDDIVFNISDDGVGMNEATLSTILSDDSKNKGSGNNIAVYNTHLRLKLLYGDNYGLSYSSRPGLGCDVLVRIKKTIGNL